MTNISQLDSYEIYTLVLFALYKMTKVPEYSVLSELLFILDRKTLLKLCAIFGGQTIKIPTFEELATLLNALYLYQKIDIEKLPVKEAIKDCNIARSNLPEVMQTYEEFSKLLNNGGTSIGQSTDAKS